MPLTTPKSRSQPQLAPLHSTDSHLKISTCVRHRQLRVNRATAELLTPTAIPVSLRGHSILSAAWNKSFEDILDPSPYQPQQVLLTLQDRALISPLLTAPRAAIPPEPLPSRVGLPPWCPGPSPASVPALLLSFFTRQSRGPAKMLSEIMSLPCSRPSIGLPSQRSEAPQRSGGPVTVRPSAPVPFGHCSSSTGPRLLTLQVQLFQGLCTGHSLLLEPPPLTAA